ncbi:MAG: 4Fe-4S dicluster domain-containing protein [Lentisphaerae bacterium]|nr:4Fe-4S dicluster domain-containing protein [Lentisphaerota bacterium]
MRLCEHDKCTGCGLCKAVCPRAAISFEVDSLGFRYPKIDIRECIDCGLCAKKCPSINPVKRELGNECYLAWAKDDDIHYESSSGGVAYLLQHHIIDLGGYVVGCVWDSEFNARLVVIDNANDLAKSVGSKYVQSYVDDGAWKEIKKRDSKGQQGVFIGLPCQVAAAKSFLNGSSNVLFVDLLCRGGCSPSCLKAHLSYLEEKNKFHNVRDVKFRGGKYDCSLTLWNERGLIYKGGQYTDKYFYSFMKHGLFHESCYHCQYANSKRVSDITLADFWGIDSEFVKSKHKMNGMNLVLIHSGKGRTFWDTIKDKIEFYKRPFEEAIRGNDTLREPTLSPCDREMLLSLIENVGFERAVSSDEQYKRNIRAQRVGYVIKAIKKIIPRPLLEFIKRHI